MSPALALALVLGAGLRVDAPEDAPVAGGVEVDLRWFALPDAFVGLALGWRGGVDDTNPDRKLISQRVDALALLGGRLAVTPDWALGLTGRAGLSRVEGWPRGLLPRVSQFSPLVGGDASVEYALSPTLALEARGGLAKIRVDDVWPLVPSGGLSLLWRLDAP